VIEDRRGGNAARYRSRKPGPSPAATETHRRKSVDYARRALEADGDDPSVLANAAFALGILGENIGAMIALLDRALTLNPSFAVIRLVFSVMTI
jgi:hypothetical protein